MLKQLVRIARMPPSPKNSAWMMSATLTEITAAQGPGRSRRGCRRHRGPSSRRGQGR